MTATEPAAPVCPECGGQNTMVLSDGNGRCFDDGHEWDPTTVTAIPRPPRPVQPAQESNQEAAPSGGAEQDGTVGQTFDLIGGTVRLEGGQIGELLSFDGDDHALVKLGDGRTERVPLGDIEAIAEPQSAVSVGADPTPQPGIVIAPADAYLMSNLLLELGVGSILDGEHGPEVGPPPVGIHDYSAEALELVSAGAIVAIERLIIAYDVDVDDLLEGLIERPKLDPTVTTTTEVDSDTSTSNAD